LKEWEKEITAIAYRLINEGWLVSFFWDHDSNSNPTTFIPNFTERGKSNLTAIHSVWKKSGVASLSDLETNKIPFISELGQPMTTDDLEALSIIAGVCALNYSKTDS
jgi:hypothetical protein